jgi:ankyrin repeat protein
LSEFNFGKSARNKQKHHCKNQPFKLNTMKRLTFIFILLVSYSTAHAQKIFKAVKSKNYAEVERLVSKGANIDQYNSAGLFPLWMAAGENDTTMAKLLIRLGAKVNQFIDQGDGSLNSLHIACQEGYLPMVRILVEAGSSVNEKGVAGFGPLRIAARNGWIEVVRYLTEKGAMVDAKARDGATALSHACAKGHVEIVKYLLEKGANVNNQDKEEDTPLMEAARVGNLELAKLLVSNGAKLDMKNKKKQTAVEVAKEQGQNIVANYLIDLMSMK